MTRCRHATGASRTIARAGFTCISLLVAIAAPAADRFYDARSFIRDEMAEAAIPSVAVAVAHRGKVILEEAVGWADREQRVPATEHTLYMLASVSKPFTATGLMTLVQQGKIDLDRPINDYLGDAKLTARVGNAADATVRRVANHTAGLPIHYSFYFSDESLPQRSRDATILRYGNITVPPGEQFVYSNLGYGLLDLVISRVSGQPFADFMRNEVFLPLGLTRTFVRVPPELESQRAIGYDDIGRRIPVYTSDDDGGPGRIHSSAHDLVRFGLFHLKHRGPDQRRILPDASLDLMHIPTTRTGPNEGYAIGFRTQERDRGRSLVYHRGGSPGASTLLWLVPADDLVVVVLTNSRSGREPRIADQLARAVIGNWPAERELVRNANAPREVRAEAAVPPASLRGTWSGKLHTYERDLPLTLDVKESGDVHVRLDDQPITLLNGASFRDGWLRGSWMGTVDTADAAPRGRPGIALFLKLREGKLIGSASASSTGLRAGSLSHWVELERP